MQRYTDTDKWEEDWYCDLGGEYQKLWDYICDKSDNAGIWKPNKTGFEMKTKFKVNLDSFRQKVNGDKERILLLDNGRWFLSGFIKYQWFNKKNGFSLNLGNNLHKSIYNILVSNAVPLEKIRGLTRVLEASRERGNTIVKEVYNNTLLIDSMETPARPLPDPSTQKVDLPPPRPPHAPNLKHVIEFFWQQGKVGDAGEKEASNFFNHYEALGWRVGITPISSWRSMASKWISNPLPQKPANYGNSKTPTGTIIPTDKKFGKF